MKRIVCSMVILVLVAITGLASCAPTGSTASPTATTRALTTAPLTAPTTPAAQPGPASQSPKYGGTIALTTTEEQYVDSYNSARGSSVTDLTSQELWEGDWSKGPAGGYGSNKTDWGMAMNNLFDLKTGYLAESVKWSVDAAKDEGTIVYQIRQGVHYALDSTKEASRLVGGREVTADDIVFQLKRAVSSQGASIWRSNPELRSAQITKTGPWEVTVKVQLGATVEALNRLGEGNRLLPPEVTQKYGNPIADWRNLVGTGPFMLADFVDGSAATLVRNPNFWMKDPVGPGKGNQLPYLDRVKVLIIPDLSTRYAALRTGKLDQIWNIPDEDAAQIRTTAPQLKEKEEVSFQGRGYGAQIVHNRPPFSDIRVRQALMLATDFNRILKDYFHGRGQIMSWPYTYIPDYADLYVGLDDPQLPQSVKDLYKYSPDRAKQLLKEAGYPGGFKTSILLTSGDVDYFTIYVDMWAKVGIELTLDIKETGAFNNILNNRQQTALVSRNTAPIAIFLTMASFSGTAPSNASMMNDPFVEEMRPKIQTAAITDQREAMRLHKEVSRHIVEQVYAIPRVAGYLYTFWWPWLKNYSGELSIGYDNRETWAQWVWLDQSLKSSMGY